MESVNTINKSSLPPPNTLQQNRKPVVMYMENCAQQIFFFIYKK